MNAMKLVREEVRQVRQQLEPKDSSNLTSYTIGKEQYDLLQRTHHWNRVSVPGNPVISQDKMASLPDAQCTESELIQWLTPHIQNIVNLASTVIGSPLVLVNSERHNWVEDTSPVGALSRPDMFVCNPAFFASNQTEGDKKYTKENFLFGAPAHWNLRDCLEVVIECKRNIVGDFSALGQGVEYARRIMYAGREVHVPLDRTMVCITRLILADRDSFYLVLCQRGEAVNCVWGNWTDPGGLEAMVDHLAHRISERRWVSAISSLCKHFDVDPIVQSADNPSVKRPCFLGRGASGRVFGVVSKSDQKVYGLKVALESISCDHLRQESLIYASEKKQLHALGYIVSLSELYLDPANQFAGLLVSPVGHAFQKTKKNIISAVLALRNIANSGCQHGDARFPNVVIHDGKAIWLDLKTFNFVHGSKDDANVKVFSFLRDLDAFVRSFDEQQVDKKILEANASAFLDSGEENCDLINALASLWGGK